MTARLPCPPWEYSDHPNHRKVLGAQLALLLQALRTNQVSVEHEGADTRTIHQHLFHQLTPPAYPYYAGHYRGENFPCLVDYTVAVLADPMVGIHYSRVQAEMARFAEDLVEAARLVDEIFSLPNAAVSREAKLYSAVVLASRAFVEFLTIHPYANGNGHLARFLVWLLLGRQDYWPNSWTIEPRPNVSNYSSAISGHRRGNALPLERLILESIVL